MYHDTYHVFCSRIPLASSTSLERDIKLLSIIWTLDGHHFEKGARERKGVFLYLAEQHFEKGVRNETGRGLYLAEQHFEKGARNERGGSLSDSKCEMYLCSPTFLL
jgi:hypothetical protein